MSNNSSNIAIKVETLKEINIGNLTLEFVSLIGQTVSEQFKKFINY